jgi:hypothetical protein
VHLQAHGIVQKSRHKAAGSLCRSIAVNDHKTLKTFSSITFAPLCTGDFLLLDQVTFNSSSPPTKNHKPLFSLLFKDTKYSR